MIVDSQPVSDFLGFHRRAAAVAGGDLGQLLDTKSPPTVAYYAVFQALFGSSYAANYVAGAFAWSAGALLIYKAALRWVIDERHARFVCACVALYPSFVVFAVVPSSETIVFLLTGTGAWLLSRAIGSSGGRKTGIAALLGLTVGVLYLARMNSLILLFPCMVLLVLANSDQGVRAPWQAFGTTLPLVALAASVAAVTVAFGLVFALEKGDFRASPSSKGEVLLLFGTNTETQGGFNREDVVLAGYDSADPDVRDAAPTTARRMAFERVTGDLPRFAVFASTTKIERLWGTERPLNSYSIGDPEDREQVNYYLRGAAIFAGDSAYRVVSLLFLCFLVFQIRRPTVAVVLSGVVLLFAAPHIFIEVQARYHVPMIPFMIAGAAIALGQIGRLPVLARGGKPPWTKSATR